MDTAFLSQANARGITRQTLNLTTNAHHERPDVAGEIDGRIGPPQYQNGLSISLHRTHGGLRLGPIGGRQGGIGQRRNLQAAGAEGLKQDDAACQQGNQKYGDRQQNGDATAQRQRQAHASASGTNM
ncbi:MAG: hypothetical protein BWZ07_02667 [Alphaproteobacteria bacterium ADurb.BinA280]|nr:MAG: hypothetical protein BWZ07_02667 [Alphaproteobacteria bacterium ADurb.BinA280]